MMMFKSGAVAAGLAAAMIAGVCVMADEPAKSAAPAGASAQPVPVSNAITEPLEGFRWLSGSYRQKSVKGMAEEQWTEPHGSSMMGSFRWCKADGSPMMFELLTITREGQGESAATFLRLRHYSAKLEAKEDKDKPLTLKLDTLTPGRAVFVAHADAGDLASVTYVSPSKGRLQVEVAFKAELSRPALKFDMTSNARD